MSPEDETQQPNLGDRRHLSPSAVPTHGYQAIGPEDESQQPDVNLHIITTSHITNGHHSALGNFAPPVGLRHQGSSSAISANLMLNGSTGVEESLEDSIHWTQSQEDRFLNDPANYERLDVSASLPFPTSFEAAVFADKYLNVSPESPKAKTPSEQRPATPGPILIGASDQECRELMEDLESSLGRSIPHVSTPADPPSGSSSQQHENPAKTPRSNLFAGGLIPSRTISPGGRNGKKMFNITDVSPVKGSRSVSAPLQPKLPSPKTTKSIKTMTKSNSSGHGDSWTDEDSFAGPRVQPNQKPIERFKSVMDAVHRTNTEGGILEETEVDEESGLRSLESGESSGNAGNGSLGKDIHKATPQSQYQVESDENGSSNFASLEEARTKSPQKGRLDIPGVHNTSNPSSPQRPASPSPERVSTNGLHDSVLMSSPQAQSRRKFGILANSGSSPKTQDLAHLFSSSMDESVGEPQSSPTHEMTFIPTQMVSTLERSGPVQPKSPPISALARTTSAVSVSSNSSKLNISDHRKLVGRRKQPGFNLPTPVVHSAPATKNKRRTSPVLQGASSPAQIAQETYVDEQHLEPGPVGPTESEMALPLDAPPHPASLSPVRPPRPAQPAAQEAEVTSTPPSRPSRNRNAPNKFTPTKPALFTHTTPEAGPSRIRAPAKGFPVQSNSRGRQSGTRNQSTTPEPKMTVEPRSKAASKRKRSPTPISSGDESPETLPDLDDSTFISPGKHSRFSRKKMEKLDVKPNTKGKGKQSTNAPANKRQRVTRSSTKDSTPLTVIPSEGGPLRVLASWSKDKSYYPGTVQSRTGTILTINYDDGSKASVSINQVRKLLLRAGDIISTSTRPIVDMTVTEDWNGQESGVEVEKDGKAMGFLLSTEFYIRRAMVERDFSDRMIDPSELEVEVMTTPSKRKSGPPSRVFEGFTFMVSKSGDSKVDKTIEQYGGRIANDWSDLFDHINGNARFKKGIKPFQIWDGSEIVLKPKVMVALARGIPCLDASYVRDAIQRQNAHWSSYLISAGYSTHLNRNMSQFVDKDWAGEGWSSETAKPTRAPFAGKKFAFVELRSSASSRSSNNTADINKLATFCIASFGADVVDTDIDGGLGVYDYIVVDNRNAKIPADLERAENLCNIEWLKQCLIMGSALPPALMTPGSAEDGGNRRRR